MASSGNGVTAFRDDLEGNAAARLLSAPISTCQALRELATIGLALSLGPLASVMPPLLGSRMQAMHSKRSYTVSLQRTPQSFLKCAVLNNRTN